MTNFFKALTFGVMLAASSSLAAYASPLSGSVTIDGGYGAITPGTLNSGTTSINFAGSDEYTLGGTGSFATGVGLQFATFPTTFSIPFTNGTAFTGEVLFSFTYQGTQTETFTVTSVTTGANGSLYFYGTLNGQNTGSAVYILTPGTDGLGEFSGTFTVTPTPEPSSLILLGTGLVGAAGLMFRKRRAVTAV